jgi:hypothetical protein
MIWMTVDGQPIGATLQVKGGGTVEIHASAQSIFPLHTLQIVQGGKVVAQTDEAKGTRSLELRTKIIVDSDTWVAARCAGPDYRVTRHFDRRKRGIMAHTSPVYLTCGEVYTLLDPASAQYMLTLIEGSLAYLREASPQYPPDRVTHHHGGPDHLEYLEEPFHQARQALHQRMHAMGIPH